MKIYLSSYYTRQYNVPKDVHYINIARKDMVGIKDKRIILAPSQELFSWYYTHKNESNWFDTYKIRYYQQILPNKQARAEIDKIKELARTKDVCLLCFCRTADKCHRSIVGNILKGLGLEVIDTDK